LCRVSRLRKHAAVYLLWRNVDRLNVLSPWAALWLQPSTAQCALRLSTNATRWSQDANGEGRAAGCGWMPCCAAARVARLDLPDTPPPDTRAHPHVGAHACARADAHQLCPPTHRATHRNERSCVQAIAHAIPSRAHVVHYRERQSLWDDRSNGDLGYAPSISEMSYCG
jgi:hypothetical protein